MSRPSTDYFEGMINMIGREKFKQKLNSENGSAIIEATFVFPIMFIILFFLIFMGNAFYMKAKVEAVVAESAIEGASYCTDPNLEAIKNGTTPNLKTLETKPYRYIFGGMSEVEKNISSDVADKIKSGDMSLFKNMSPVLTTPTGQIAKYNSNVLYSTFTVEVEYTIKFPIRYLGASSPTILKINSRSEVPVDDTAEFIRNTDMVIDVFSGTKVGQKISDVFGKINDFISNFAKK